jgi:succinate dehydrogenase/fumarate reductase flavoprotein subunit
VNAAVPDATGELPVVDTEVLVLGGGVAGYRAASAAAQAGASVVHAFRARGASQYIFGFNVPLAHRDARDTPECYAQDILRGGYHLNDPSLVETLVAGARPALDELVAIGVPFAREGDRFDQLGLSGNTFPRSVYHPHGLGTLAIGKLDARCAALGVRKYAGWKAIALLRDGDEVVGALLFRIGTGELLAVHAGSTVLATGGIGQIYADSTYPADVAADSYAMAHAAGATLIDMEFVQFEPTVVVHPEACRGLVMPTAMFGEGAQLLNATGERFMLRYNPGHAEQRIEKARLAHCIRQEVAEGRGYADGSVLFDTTVVPPHRLENHVEKLKRLRSKGFEPTREAPRVRPAAHSHMGGVRIDPGAWTGVPGLYAAGEAAGGVHGASRLAGNGASDVFVFGGVAGRAAAAGRSTRADRAWRDIHARAVEPLRIALGGGAGPRPDEIKAAVRATLLEAAGLYRDAAGLRAGRDALDALDAEIRRGLEARDAKEAVRALEAANMIGVGRFIVLSALAREESRGAHQRTDFPATDDDRWKHHAAVLPGNGRAVGAVGIR